MIIWKEKCKCYFYIEKFIIEKNYWEKIVRERIVQTF